MPSDRELEFHDADGVPVYRYSDGALRKKGAYYKRPPQAAEPFDTNTAIAANLAKSVKREARIASLQGEVTRTLVKKTRAKTPEQAGAKLVGQMIDIAQDTDERAADRLATTKFVLQAAGMQAKEQSNAPSITLQMTPEAIDRMYALSMGVVVDAEVRELEDAGVASSELTASEASGGLDSD